MARAGTGSVEQNHLPEIIIMMLSPLALSSLHRRMQYQPHLCGGESWPAAL